MFEPPCRLNFRPATVPSSSVPMSSRLPVGVHLGARIGEVVGLDGELPARERRGGLLHVDGHRARERGRLVLVDGDVAAGLGREPHRVRVIADDALTHLDRVEHLDAGEAREAVAAGVVHVDGEVGLVLGALAHQQHEVALRARDVAVGDLAGGVGLVAEHDVEAAELAELDVLDDVELDVASEPGLVAELVQAAERPGRDDLVPAPEQHVDRDDGRLQLVLRERDRDAGVLLDHQEPGVDRRLAGRRLGVQRREREVAHELERAGRVDLVVGEVPVAVQHALGGRHAEHVDAELEVDARLRELVFGDLPIHLADVLLQDDAQVRGQRGLVRVGARPREIAGERQREQARELGLFDVELGVRQRAVQERSLFVDDLDREVAADARHAVLDDGDIEVGHLRQHRDLPAPILGDVALEATLQDHLAFEGDLARLELEQRILERSRQQVSLDRLMILGLELQLERLRLVLGHLGGDLRALLDDDLVALVADQHLQIGLQGRAEITVECATLVVILAADLAFEIERADALAAVDVHRERHLALEAGQLALVDLHLDGAAGLQRQRTPVARLQRPVDGDRGLAVEVALAGREVEHAVERAFDLALAFLRDLQDLELHVVGFGLRQRRLRDRELEVPASQEVDRTQLGMRDAPAFDDVELGLAVEHVRVAGRAELEVHVADADLSIGVVDLEAEAAFHAEELALHDVDGRLGALEHLRVERRGIAQDQRADQLDVAVDVVFTVLEEVVRVALDAKGRQLLERQRELRLAVHLGELVLLDDRADLDRVERGPGRADVDLLAQRRLAFTGELVGVHVPAALEAAFDILVHDLRAEGRRAPFFVLVGHLGVGLLERDAGRYLDRLALRELAGK